MPCGYKTAILYLDKFVKVNYKKYKNGSRRTAHGARRGWSSFFTLCRAPCTVYLVAIA
jgi:hypothetical protein